MSNPLPSMPPGQPTAIPVDSSSTLWDRLSSWISDNKAVVYTIAGVAVVVTGAGAVYYLNSVRLMAAPVAPCSMKLVGAAICFLPSRHMANLHRSIELRSVSEAQQEGEAEAKRGRAQSRRFN